MTIKPFAIQGADLTLGGVNLQAGTTGVVIPGVTRATGYKVEEVNDTADQTHAFAPDSEVVVIDYVLYNAIVNQAPENLYADYTAPTDGEGYIDGIQVNGQGTYTQQEATDNAANDMYAYVGAGSASDRPLVPQDWITIPFRPRMRAGAIETISGGGSGNGSELVNGDYAFTLNNNGTITLPKGVTFTAPNHDLSWQGWDYINIQGTSGYYSNYPSDSINGGEGTSISLQAGLGGESNDFIHGGKGGILDFHAGNGQHGGNGGAVTIGAGDATWNNNTNVRGGDINLTAGDATNQNYINAGHGTGGDLHLGAGRGNHAGGSVFVHTSDDHTGTNFTKLWEFDQDGQLNLPANSVGDSVIYSDTGNVELYTGNGPGSKVKIRVKGTGDVEWLFNEDGSVTFPDATTQTTAYTGQSGGGGSANINNWLLDIVTTNTATGYVAAIAAVEYDTAGNVLATGYRSDGGPGQAITLMKFDTHGNLIWQNLFADSVNIDGYGLAVDNNDDVIVTGKYDGKLFLLKTSGVDGSGIWGTSIANAATGTNTTIGLTVDVDSHNDIIVTGYVESGAYNDDMIVAKFANADGAFIWGRKLGDEYFDQSAYGLGVGSLNQNEVVVIGYNEHYTGGVVTGVANVSPASNPAWVGTDITVVSPNNSNHGLHITVSFTDGVPTFTVVDGSSGHGTGDNWSIDGAILGGASGTDDMGFSVTVDQPYTQDNSAVVVKYDTDGVLQWQKEISVDGNYCYGSDADIDSNGNIYVAANYGQNNTSSWGVVMQMNSVGDLQWSRQIGLGYCFAGNSSIVVGTDNLVYVGGMSSVGSVNNLTDANIFVGAYNESGTVQWQRTYGSPNRVEIIGAMFDNNGASNFDIHGDYLVFGGGNYNNFFADNSYPQDPRGFIFQMDKSGAEQMWGTTTLVPSFLPETAVTLTVTTSTLPDVEWIVTQALAEPPYNPDDLTITKTLGLLGSTNGSSELVNGLKILKLETNGTITPPTIATTATLAVNGNISVARPHVGFAVTQGNNNSDTWATANDVDADGNIYVAGGFYDWDWDGDDRPTVIKYSPTGEKLWQCVFRYEGSMFGGTSYSIEYEPIHQNVIVVFTNWYNYHRTQIVTLDAADGSVQKSDEISTINNNDFYPRGLALDSTGTWVIAGEANSTLSVTTGTKVSSTSSTYGILVLPKTYFSTWGHYPVSQNNWGVQTTWGVDNYSNDYVYYVNRYYNVPTFNLIGSGANFSLDIEYNPDTGEVTYQNQYDGGIGYSVGDAVYIKGSNLGATSDTPVVADSGASIALVDTATVITTVTPNIDWVDVTASVASTGSWRAIIFNDGSNLETSIVSASYDGTNAVLILDQDYSGSLTTATSNIIVYNSEGANLVFFITAVDPSTAYVTNNNRFGLVHSDTVKLDCENSTDFGSQFQQILTNIVDPANHNLSNAIMINKTDAPRWADIQPGWTYTDGTNTGTVTGAYDPNDGTYTISVDGAVYSDGLVTVTSPIEQYRPYYTTNNDAGIVTSDGIALTWGTANEDQRFNVVEYGHDRSIYAAGYGYNNDNLGNCSLLVKFNSAGTEVLWHKLFQGTNTTDDYDIHGLEVVTELGQEYAYVITYDDNSNGMLYKINGTTGDIVWCSYVLGGATGTNIYWNRGAAIRIASNGDVVVAGIARENNHLYTNSRVVMVIRVSPVDGHLIGAQEILNNLNNDIDSRYEGNESDFQFELHSTTTNGVTTEYFVASLYTYTGNRDEAVNIKIPLNEPVMSFVQSIFEIYNITTGLASAVYQTEEYQTTTYTNATINHGSLTLTANKNLIANNGSPYWGTDLYEVIDVLGGSLGEVKGVKALTFEDGSAQTSAYSPLMKSVTSGNWWYYVQAGDAGKFMYCDGYTGGIQLPDDSYNNLPIGWAMTIIAPLNKDIYINPNWNNSPPTLVVPGNNPQTNSNQYNGWKLNAGGMVTVLKVASNTYYISGGKLEAQ